MKDRLRDEVETTKRETFVEGYDATDEEAFGIIVSKFFEYDGFSIMKVAAYALEDANYHKECKEVFEMLERAKARRGG